MKHTDDFKREAVRIALSSGLSRRREPPPIRSLDVVVDLKLKHPPVADCARYDTVTGLDAAG